MTGRKRRSTGLLLQRRRTDLVSRVRHDTERLLCLHHPLTSSHQWPQAIGGGRRGGREGREGRDQHLCQLLPVSLHPRASITLDFPSTPMALFSRLTLCVLAALLVAAWTPSATMAQPPCNTTAAPASTTTAPTAIDEADNALATVDELLDDEEDALVDADEADMDDDDDELAETDDEEDEEEEPLTSGNLRALQRG